MKHYDSILVGHITVDANTDHLGHTVKGPGGAVLYSSAAAKALGHKVAVVTKVADAEKDRLAAFTIPAEDVYCLPSQRSTNMENVYFTADKERRKTTCLSQGDVLSAADVPADIEGDIYHVAGLIYGDYDENIIPDLARRGKVAVDVQGYLRHTDFSRGGEMYFEDWKDKMEMLPLISFLKTDAAEAEILTGLTDRAEAAKLLYRWGAKEVMITHNTEVLAYDGKEICTCPIRARNLSGRTGRGDTTFSSYITERLTHSVKDALLTATATVSLKMEKPGAITATRAEIEAYIRELYADVTG